MGKKEILNEAAGSRIPFGVRQGDSVLLIAEEDPDYLIFLLNHPYALSYHPWLKRLIIRTLAALGKDWH